MMQRAKRLLPRFYNTRENGCCQGPYTRAGPLMYPWRMLGKLASGPVLAAFMALRRESPRPPPGTSAASVSGRDGRAPRARWKTSVGVMQNCQRVGAGRLPKGRPRAMAPAHGRAWLMHERVRRAGGLYTDAIGAPHKHDALFARIARCALWSAVIGTGRPATAFVPDAMPRGLGFRLRPHPVIWALPDAQKLRGRVTVADGECGPRALRDQRELGKRARMLRPPGAEADDLETDSISQRPAFSAAATDDTPGAARLFKPARFISAGPPRVYCRGGRVFTADHRPPLPRSSLRPPTGLPPECA
ncbi:hypothetical protein MRX96_002462 [Rhipicephalus microplus]